MTTPLAMSAFTPSKQRAVCCAGGRWHQRGLSIVELLVGITIGLFIVAGATLMLTTQLGDNRRLLLEAQMQQDMRAAADMIARDIRRAGYWAAARQQVWPTGAVLVDTNPYRTLLTDGTGQVVYDRSTDEEGALIGTDDGVVDSTAKPSQTREHVGFRYNSTAKTIDYLLGTSWQALTDSAVLQVTQFELAFNTQDLPLPCGVQCPVTGPGGCGLVQRARDVSITIVAQAVHEPGLQRTLRDNVRLRNDEVRCP